MTQTIELISFPGTGNLPFFAGSEKGIYGCALAGGQSRDHAELDVPGG